MYEPTECNCSEAKEDFCRDFPRLIRNMSSTDVVVASGNFNAQEEVKDERKG